jgi:sugar/nucleoside kinase (ribokinase family)
VTGDALEVLHVGSACRDVAPDDPRGWRLGGGVTYSSLTTARLGLRTGAVVGVDAEGRGATELDLLRDAGVDLMLVPLPEAPIFHNFETTAGRVQTCLQVGVALPVTPLPESWRAAAAWCLVPVAGEVTDAWAVAIPPGALVAVAWQGFLRHLLAGERVVRKPPAASALLSRADIVGASHHDLDPGTRLDDLLPFLKPGGRMLITQGHEGGLLLSSASDGGSRTLRYHAARADDEADPTGAGDTFLAALVATVVRPEVGGRRGQPFDLRMAAAVGSLVVERPGLSGVPERAALRRRIVRERVRALVAPSAADHVGSYEADAAAGG